MCSICKWAYYFTQVIAFFKPNYFADKSFSLYLTLYLISLLISGQNLDQFKLFSDKWKV